VARMAAHDRRANGVRCAPRQVTPSTQSDRWRMFGIAVVLKEILRVEPDFIELAAGGRARAAERVRAVRIRSATSETAAVISSGALTTPAHSARMPVLALAAL
jgi:hypothetical protein